MDESLKAHIVARLPSARLSPQERAVVSLYYLGSPTTLQAVADALRVGIGTAGKAKRRAEAKLGLPKQPQPSNPGPGRPRSDDSVRATVDLLDALAAKHGITRAQAVGRLRALVG